MASQAKRIRKDVADVEDDAYVNLCKEIKKEPTVPEEPRFILDDVPMVSTSEIKDPLFIPSLKGSCSKNLMQIASDLSVAELSYEVLVKHEPSDGEKDTDCDVDNSNSKDSEKEPEDDSATAANPVFWSTDSSSMIDLPFNKQQSLLVPLPTKPYDIFRLIIDDQFLEMVAYETNTYGKRQCKDLWMSVTHQELLTFFGLLIHTGTIHLDRLHDYWKNHYLFNLTGFSTFMSRDRFMQILTCLNFSSASCEQNRLAKIQPIIDHFNNKMKSIYYPGANLTVTESTDFQGRRIPFRKKTKAHKNKLNVHVLAESSGMALKLKLSQGPMDNEKVVFDLLDEKLNCGHTVYLSEQYSSVKLAAALLERETHCTGPLDRSIKGVASMLKNLKLMQPECSSKLSYYQNGIHVCKVKKTFYLSTQHDEEMIHMPTKAGHIAIKSKLVAMYKSVMEGDSDTQEETMSFYPCQANKLKWYKKLFIHVLQQAIINSYHLNAIFNVSKKSFYAFRLDVLMKLLPDVTVPTDCAIDDGLHVLTKIEKVKFRERRERGRISVRKEVVRKECKGCKQLKKKRSATTYECRQCEGSPGYCFDCFCQTHALNSMEELEIDI